MLIAIIGAGNGGQAMAGHFSHLGHSVRLYARNLKKITPIIEANGVVLKGAISGFGKINMISESLEDVIKDVDLIMVTTVANAHKEIALNLAPIIKDGQIVVLNPGRTFGALEVRNVFNQLCPDKKIHVAETQSLLYACRAEGNGEVKIIGIKDKLPVASIPSADTDFVVEKLKEIYPSFIAAKNILETSLDNIGCIFHPSIVLFNAAKIERGEDFFFYNDMTPLIASFIEAIDSERLAIGKALNIPLLSANEWISYSYQGIRGVTLCEKMQNNPAYYKIYAPKSLNSRLLTEDIPTGVLPLIELGKLLNIETPLLNSVFVLISELLKTDFKKEGRTMANLGLDQMNFKNFINSI
ncbi:MAG: NAD/NADP octopine/nopaline dehydrogenase family protein [Brumimicrobium sp.]